MGHPKLLLPVWMTGTTAVDCGLYDRRVGEALHPKLLLPVRGR
jgi:hypothetical protein